jgi:hypothetical protein
VSCGFSVNFCLVTVFGDRSLNLDFHGHDFLVAHPIYFDFLSSDAESHRPSVPLAVYAAVQSPIKLSQWPHPALSKPADLPLFSAPVKPCAARIFGYRCFLLGVGLPLLWIVQSHVSLVPLLPSESELLGFGFELLV